MRTIHKIGLLIIQDHRFLINRKKKTSLFLMPGGKPEKDETVEQCLSRELWEEHQVKIMPDTIKFFGHFEDVAANEKDTIISQDVYIGKISGTPKPSSEIIEQRWFGRDDDVSILSPLLRNRLLPEIKRRGLIAPRQHL